MPITKRTFTEGRMNKDIDERLLPDGQYRDGLNIRIAKSDSSDAGAIENSLGNSKQTTLALGNNAECIGALSDSTENRLYWWVVSDSGSYVLEYDRDYDAVAYVLIDNRVSPNNVLNLSKKYLITGSNLIIDSDNGNRFLYWTDNLNPPRCINIDRSKAWGADNFDDQDISVIKGPPLDAPMVSLANTTSDLENNLEERFIRFAYRYQYLDGQYSALSPFSEVAFEPLTFQYDYATSSNESMVNNYSEAIIAFRTGDSRVRAVDLVFKDSGSSAVYLVDHYIKEQEGWSDDVTENITFNKNKLYTSLPVRQLNRLFDAVPLKALAQEFIGGRLIYGNYTEGYDLIDLNGDTVNPSFTVAKVSNAIGTVGTPTRSLKSIRDYEVGIAYLDGYGRQTTVLVSNDNTVYIPNSDCVNQNQLQVTLSHLAPSWATKYRFYVKQRKYDYDTIVPTLFYPDEVYVWIKLEGNEADKVNEGDFIYVKADTQEILSKVEQTRVLELGIKDRNFLEDDPLNATTTEQLAGKYMKIRPSGFRINRDDYQFYEFNGYDNSRNAYDTPIRSNQSYIEDAIYYGTVGLDDLTKGGTYSGTTDIRYIINIDATGTPDTFEWSDDDGQNFTTGVAITGAAQALSNGVTVTFGATTGHDISDTWIVSAKSQNDNSIATDMNSKAYAIFKGIGAGDTDDDVDVIEGGANIIIRYDEYGAATQFVEENFISSQRYANLEEWFYGDNVDLGIPDSRIWFRRGTVGDDGNAKFIDIDPTKEMSMIIRTTGTQNNDGDTRAKVRSFISIFQSEQNIIFETKGIVENEDVFFEGERTYDIDASGYHLGYDASDTDQSNGVDGVYLLPTFNCFAWGNGFESYKIKDLLNESSFKIDTRPNGVIEEYKENNRIKDITWSQIFEQSTNYDGLNEFNLSTANSYTELDDKYKSVQKFFNRDTDLIVFQEDKVHRVPYQKNILFGADGDPNVTQTDSVLGTPIPYAGEYGIGTNPESFAYHGNRIYFVDSERGCVLRLSVDGITEISEYGMRDWFRDLFRAYPSTKKLGGYDSYHDQYVLSTDDTVMAETPVIPCGATISVSEENNTFVFQVEINDSQGSTVYLDHVVSGTINVVIDNDGTDQTFNGLTGTGQVNFVQSKSGVTVLTVTVTAVSTDPSYDLSIPCLIPTIPAVVANDDSTSVISGNTVNVNVLQNDSYVNPVTVTIDTQGATGTATVQGDKTIDYAHGGANTNPDSFIYQIDDGNTTDTATVNVTVQASGGGGGATGQSFNISSQSYFDPFSPSNGEGACPYLTDLTKYHDGINLYPILADTVYNDVNKTTPFAGGSRYYAIANGRTIKIDNSGVITDEFICTGGGGGNA